MQRTEVLASKRQAHTLHLPKQLQTKADVISRHESKAESKADVISRHESKADVISRHET